MPHRARRQASGASHHAEGEGWSLHISTQDPSQHRARVEAGAVVAGAGGDEQGVAPAMIEPAHTQMFTAVGNGGDEAAVLEHGDVVVDELAGAGGHDEPPPTRVRLRKMPTSQTTPSELTICRQVRPPKNSASIT